ncbi:hypothetical protein VPH35_076851 [Triticum aestivum]
MDACGVVCRVLRGQVRGAVRAVAREAGGVHEVLRAVLRGVRLRAHGEERQPRRVPLLPRHAHRRPQEEAQVPLTALSSAHRLKSQRTNGFFNLYSTLPTGVVAQLLYVCDVGRACLCHFPVLARANYLCDAYCCLLKC